MQIPFTLKFNVFKNYRLFSIKIWNGNIENKDNIDTYTLVVIVSSKK